MSNVKCEECGCVVEEENVEQDCPRECTDCPLCENQCDDNYVPLDFNQE